MVPVPEFTLSIITVRQCFLDEQAFIELDVSYFCGINTI